MRGSIAEKASGLWTQIRKEKVSYAFVAPFYLLFCVFTILPVAISIFYGFTYYNILEAPTWIGWGNYTRLFLADDVFKIALKNTIVYALVVGPVSYLGSLLIAWMINDLNPHIRSIMVLLFYAPSISGNVYLIWRILFSSDSYGYINAFLLQTGLINQPVKWLQVPEYILPIIMVVALWLSLGTTFLSFVAGFQGLDKTLYEAGAMDGIRNRWQELWFITLPSLKPQLMFGAVISITNAFAVSDVAINMAGLPSVGYGGHTIVTHLMDYGNIRFEMGYASAIATVLFVLMVGINKLVNIFIGRIGK